MNVELSAMLKITVGLSVIGLAALSAASAEETISYRAVVTPVLEGSETIIDQPIAYPDGQAKFTAVIVALPPGGETGWHIHPVPLFGYMLEGELTVDYGTRGKRVYTPGDGLLEAMNWPHNGVNESDAPLRILAVYAGADGIANAEKVDPPK
jgi:quercetin dioxygenase-like cupin family protein